MTPQRYLCTRTGGPPFPCSWVRSRLRGHASPATLYPAATVLLVPCGSAPLKLWLKRNSAGGLILAAASPTCGTCSSSSRSLRVPAASCSPVTQMRREREQHFGTPITTRLKKRHSHTSRRANAGDGFEHRLAVCALRPPRRPRPRVRWALLDVSKPESWCAATVRAFAWRRRQGLEVSNGGDDEVSVVTETACS